MDIAEFLLLLALAPVALILWYVYKKDPHKEPFGVLAKAFGFGVLSIIPVLVFELIFDNFFPTDVEKVNTYTGLFINVVISVALIEEFFKWLVVKLANYNNRHFDESYDAIVYCVFASLGFAMFENVLYVLGQMGAEGIGMALFTAIFRFLTAVPGHAFEGVVMGFFLSKAKKAQFDQNKTTENKYLFFSIMIPAILHAIYDFLIMSQLGIFILLWFGFVIAMNIVSIKLIKKAAEQNYYYRNINMNNYPNNNQGYNPQNGYPNNNQGYNPQNGYPNNNQGYNPQSGNPNNQGYYNGGYTNN